MITVCPITTTQWKVWQVDQTKENLSTPIHSPYFPSHNLYILNILTPACATFHIYQIILQVPGLALTWTMRPMIR